MSGGEFDYKQYHFHDIAEQIDLIIRDNKKKDEYGFCYGFSDEILKMFREARDTAYRAYLMINRVDYLVSSDDGEQSFVARWHDDLSEELFWESDKSVEKMKGSDDE